MQSRAQWHLDSALTLKGRRGYIPPRACCQPSSLSSLYSPIKNKFYNSQKLHLPGNGLCETFEAASKIVHVWGMCAYMWCCKHACVCTLCIHTACMCVYIDMYECTCVSIHVNMLCVCGICTYTYICVLLSQQNLQSMINLPFLHSSLA